MTPKIYALAAGILVLVNVSIVAYSNGLYAGQKEHAGCYPPKGQQRLAELAFRDADGKLHCQRRMNPYYGKMPGSETR